MFISTSLLDIYLVYYLGGLEMVPPPPTLEPFELAAPALPRLSCFESFGADLSRSK
jgi:hypothetical protein